MESLLMIASALLGLITLVLLISTEGTTRRIIRYFTITWILAGIVLLLVGSEYAKVLLAFPVSMAYFS